MDANNSDVNAIDDARDENGQTLLNFVVKSGCFSLVEDMLRHRPDINNQSNRSSLKVAVYGNGEEYKMIVEALLEYGFSVDPEDANNPKLLHAAVMKGYLKIIEDLLKYGADVNTIHEDFNSFLDVTYSSVHPQGFTPLHIAARYKQEEVAKLLISCGADINAQDKSGNAPIFYAVESADLKMTNLLLTHGASITHCPALLNKAVEKECIVIVEVILQHDLDINASDEDGRTALHFTALSDHEDGDINIKGEIAELLLSRGASVDTKTRNGETTLNAAAKKGYVKVVEALLKYNANVNSRGETSGITPLYLSADGGNEEICAMLLNKGAHVNATLNDGTTALHIAIERGHKEVVKVLLERGAKFDSEMKRGCTPLHLGAKYGYHKIVETILKFNGNIASQDECGRTPLHIAIANGHDKVVVTLLEYGSDINITCGDGRTPLDDAMFGIRFYNQIDNCRFVGYDLAAREAIFEALKRHIVKMKTANLYVSVQNLRAMSRCGEISGFQKECKEEIARMKHEKINCQNISFYDILAKGTSSLAIYMRNENIKWALQSGLYKVLFPIYASMINCHFSKAMERKESLDQGKKKFKFLFEKFPKLPYDCTEKILSYLSNEDLKN